LQLEVEACEKCTSLSATRIKPIFGQGSSKPVILFLGDSPIAEEDRKSQLFVDEAGELFQKMMVACGLTPEEIYITTALKCRLPGSREAKPQERENCRGYLEAQIMELQPQAICCFGESASRGLLNSLEEWNSLRAGKHQYIGFPVYCTYHPRTLLKNANLKRDTWDDLRRMLKELGRAVN
jgi:DNA polymerase